MSVEKRGGGDRRPHHQSDLRRPGISRDENEPGSGRRFARALADQRAGRMEQAIEGYRQVLALDPNHSEARVNLGTALKALGRPLEALNEYEAVLRRSPEHEGCLYNMANALRALGRFEDAEARYRVVLRLNPKYREADTNLALTLIDMDRADEAIPILHHVLEGRHGDAEAWNNLGFALFHQGKLEAACAAYRQAVARHPGYCQALTNLGVALGALGRLDEEACAHADAIRLDPGFAEAHENLGFTYTAMNRLDDALACYARALEIAPNNATAVFNRGLARLLKGDLVAGFQDYESRWRAHSLRAYKFPQPLWGGDDLTRRTILLYAEQGFGDTIQFVRYAPLVKDRGGRVIVECQPELAQLVKEMAAVDLVVVRGEPRPPFDFHAPLLSLPHLLGTSLETVPADVPYLTVARVARVEARPDVRVKVGIVWAGRPTHKNDRNRSCPLTDFLPLAANPDVELYSLQKGPGEGDLAELGVRR